MIFFLAANSAWAKLGWCVMPSILQNHKPHVSLKKQNPKIKSLFP